jgi:hypothetical protein
MRVDATDEMIEIGGLKKINLIDGIIYKRNIAYVKRLPLE